MMTISTLGWSLKPLRDFIEVCHQHKLETTEDRTTVFFTGDHYMPGSGGHWSSIDKSVRKLDTIDIEEHVKADIIRDAEECKIWDCT